MINKYLDYIQHEGIFSSTRKAGEHTGKELEPFRFFAGKAAKGAATAVGKTAAAGTKVAAKGIWGAAKGVSRFAGGVLKAPGKAHRVMKKTNKAIKSPIPSPYNVAKSYFKKPLNKMRK